VGQVAVPNVDDFVPAPLPGHAPVAPTMVEQKTPELKPTVTHVVPEPFKVAGGQREDLQPGSQASFTGGTEVTEHVVGSYGPVLIGGQRQPLVGQQSSFAGTGQATVIDVTDANYGPVVVSGSRPEVVGQVTEAFTGQATGVPATALIPATVSVPATSLTPANTVSIPVEMPATATTPLHSESAKPSRSKARTEVKATEAHDSSAQLAHTGADDAAALAALALALMGTGITLVGVNRRRQAA
jgi:hypothetical protein